MKTQNADWFAAICQAPAEDWGPLEPPTLPVVPCVTHPLHPKLRDLFVRLGVTKKLSPDGSVIALGQPINQVGMVVEGVVGRFLGQKAAALAIATPWRFACGNLNLFTGHPALGSYFTLTEAEVLLIPSDLLRRMLMKEPELAWLFAMQCELAALSDRMTFTVFSRLPVGQRLKAFCLAWANNFARVITLEGDVWFEMPALIQRRFLRLCINTSIITLDKLLKDWKDAGVLRSESHRVLIRAEWLRDVHDWLVSMEDPSVNAMFTDYTQVIQTIAGRNTKTPRVFP